MATRSTRLRKPPPVQQSEQQPRAKWTTPLTKILVDLMVNQVQMGNKPNKSFGKKAWKSICDGFSKETSLTWGKEQLKNKYAGLRKQHILVNSLLDHTDFKWDEITGAILAKDEVWDSYIQEHPDAEILRTGGCLIYKQLCIIFSESGMIGEFNGPPGDKEGKHEPAILCPEPLTSTFHKSSTSSSSSESDEDKTDADVDNNLGKDQTTTGPPPTVTNGTKRGRKGIEDAIARAILEMAAASKLRATAALKLNGERFSITNCVKALDEMQGVDEHVYYAALDHFNNPTVRETFLSLKVDKRLPWLSGKCSVFSHF